MELVIFAADQKKEVRLTAIGGAEGDLLDCPPEHDEGGLDQELVRAARVRECNTAWNAGRAQRFSGFEACQQARRVAHLPCCLGKPCQGPEHRSFCLRLEGRLNKAGLDKTRNNRLIPVNLASAAGGALVVVGQPAALHPKNAL